jgi:hypothetical protein
VFGIDFISPAARSFEFYLPGARSLIIGAVLRSWEQRFGARLLRIGADAILQVLAERPPRTLELATQLAAEFYAFAESGPSGGTSAARARLASGNGRLRSRFGNEVAAVRCGSSQRTRWRNNLRAVWPRGCPGYCLGTGNLAFWRKR